LFILSGELGLKKILILMAFILPATGAFSAERSLSLTLTSNYVFRGETQTNDKAAVQATYQWSQFENSGFYAGFFASNVSRGAEVDLVGGIKLALGSGDSFTFDFGAVEYLYTDNTFASASHEFYAGVQFGESYLKYYFGENESRYLDLGLDFPAFAGLDWLLHYGNTSAQNNGGSNDMSVSLQKELANTLLGITLTYEDKTAKKNTELFAFVSMKF
jgi:uncharacterized protein (TIGR02001 family)